MGQKLTVYGATGRVEYERNRLVVNAEEEDLLLPNPRDIRHLGDEEDDVNGQDLLLPREIFKDKEED